MGVTLPCACAGIEIGNAVLLRLLSKFFWEVFSPKCIRYENRFSKKFFVRILIAMKVAPSNCLYTSPALKVSPSRAKCTWVLQGSRRGEVRNFKIAQTLISSREWLRK